MRFKMYEVSNFIIEEIISTLEKFKVKRTIKNIKINSFILNLSFM